MIYKMLYNGGGIFYPAFFYFQEPEAWIFHIVYYGLIKLKKYKDG